MDILIIFDFFSYIVHLSILAVLGKDRMNKMLYIDLITKNYPQVPYPEYGLLHYKDPTDDICRNEFNCAQLKSNLLWALNSRNISYLGEFYDLTAEHCKFRSNRYIEAQNMYTGFVEYFSNCPKDSNEEQEQDFDYDIYNYS